MLPIRLLKPQQTCIRISKPRIDRSKIKRGNVPPFGLRAQLFECLPGRCAVACLRIRIPNSHQDGRRLSKRSLRLLILSDRFLLLKPTTYSEEKCRRHPGCVPRDRWFQCPRPTISISLCKWELSGVTLRLHFPHFVAHVAQTGRASAWAG